MNVACMEDLSKQRFYNTDFSGRDLSKAKMCRSLFHNCNFDRANMSEANCEGSDFIGSTFRDTNCYRTNFKDAKLAATTFEPRDCFGMTLTMQCKTFDQMRISPLWWYSWLIFATMMRPDRFPAQEEMLNKLIATIGAERYVKLKHLFAKREF